MEVLLRARAPGGGGGDAVAFRVRGLRPEKSAEALAKAFRKAFAGKYGRACEVTRLRRGGAVLDRAAAVGADAAAVDVDWRFADVQPVAAAAASAPRANEAPAPPPPASKAPPAPPAREARRTTRRAYVAPEGARLGPLPVCFDVGDGAVAWATCGPADVGRAVVPAGRGEPYNEYARPAPNVSVDSPPRNIHVAAAAPPRPRLGGRP